MRMFSRRVPPEGYAVEQWILKTEARSDNLDVAKNALLFVAGVVAPFCITGEIALWILIPVLLLSGLAFWWPRRLRRIAREQRARATLEARNKEDVARDAADGRWMSVLNQFAAPAAELLTQACHTGVASPSVGEILQVVSNGLLVGHDGHDVRVVYFVAENGVLRPVRLRNGKQASEREFARGVRKKPRGVWARAESGLPLLYTDLEREKPDDFAWGKRKYKTFVTCGVLDGAGQVVGMLNLDSMSAGDLGLIDKAAVGLFARLLAVAHEMADASSIIGSSESEEATA